MKLITDFLRVFVLYRRFGNSTKNSAKEAWQIAVQRRRAS
jgi:hypothetical protein